jgi:hypothetical protein
MFYYANIRTYSDQAGNPPSHGQNAAQEEERTMNKRTYLIALFAFSTLILAVSNAQAVYIPDDYYGDGTLWRAGVPNPDPDIYDPDNRGYDVSGMDVTVVNNQLTVTLYGDYFTLWNTYTPSDQVFAPGSLFLSTNGWTPFDSAPYAGDDMYNGTVWNYAVTLSGILDSSGLPTASGATALYGITGGTIVAGQLRINQEAAFLPGTGQNALALGNWELAATSLTIRIDLTATGWDSTTDLGLHWTMSCGNDVIEGRFFDPEPPVPTPEPGAVLLFGCGLLGLAGFTRRRSR